MSIVVSISKYDLSCDEFVEAVDRSSFIFFQSNLFIKFYNDAYYKLKTCVDF
jgi:hypothetical protein